MHFFILVTLAVVPRQNASRGCFPSLLLLGMAPQGGVSAQSRVQRLRHQLRDARATAGRMASAIRWNLAISSNSRRRGYVIQYIIFPILTLIGMWCGTLRPLYIDKWAWEREHAVDTYMMRDSTHLYGPAAHRRVAERAERLGLFREESVS